MLEKHDLMTAPHHIMCTIMMNLSFRWMVPEKGVVSVKTKCAYGQVSGTTEHITLLCGALTAGIPLLP